MRNFARIIAFLLASAMAICLIGCNSEKENEKTADATWQSVAFSENATVGEGGKSLQCIVEKGGKSITITVKTDEENLGKALYKVGIINDASYFDTVNGTLADWDADGAYWAFYQGDEYSMVGVADVKINGGETFKFVYTDGK